MSSPKTNKSLARRLRRFYIAQPLSNEKKLMRLSAAESHHLRNIIRLRSGDHCLVTDGRGWEAEASIREFTEEGLAILDILKITKKSKERPNAVFFRAMPVLLQKGKNDYLVEKAQELGVDELWPLTSERCELRIPKEKIEKIVDRWKRIVVEASKQSGRLTMARILEPRSLKEAVQSMEDKDALVVFHPGAGSIPFPEWIEEYRAVKAGIKSLNLLIGPEGGFTEDEIDWVRAQSKNRNVWFVEFGETVYRADTAFVGILGALRFLGVV